MKTLATARAERDPSRKICRPPLKHFCILMSQVPSRAFLGLCLIHIAPLPREFCPVSLYGPQGSAMCLFSWFLQEKELQQATTAARLFYKLEAQRAPTLSLDFRGPIVQSWLKTTTKPWLDFFFFEELVPPFQSFFN